MRHVKTQVAWKKIYRRDYPTHVQDLEYTNLRGVGSGRISFHGGITGICGANGAGKTTLLMALLQILQPGPLHDTATTAAKISGDELCANVTENNVAFTKRVDLATGAITPNGGSTSVIWVDFSYQAPKLIELFSRMSNLDELLNTVEPREVPEGELSKLSYIVGKNYTTMRIYELELDGGITPYFIVETLGAKYGTETMGMGEASAHYLVWLLRAIRDSVVLIEEPETYLSPRSQVNLVDFLAYLSAECGLWIILSTHSPSVLSKIPLDHIRILCRLRDDVALVKPQRKLQYLQALGLVPNKAGVILVEDRAAREFAKVWIGHYRPDLLVELDIVDAGSDSKVLAALDFPRINNWLKIIGLLDGDAPRSDAKQNWPRCFLPGSAAPEELLIPVAEQRVEDLAKRLDIAIDVMRLAVSELAGRDHHDWLETLYRTLQVSYERLVAALFQIWIEDQTNELAAREALGDLESAIGSLAAGE